FTTETLVPVTMSDGSVPAAVDVNTTRTITLFGNDVTCSGNTMAYPLGGVGNTISNPTTGEVANQSITFDDTSGSRIGNHDPGNSVPNPGGSQPNPDGFLLQGNCGSQLATCQIIVFTASQDGASNFGVAAAGFTANGNLEQTTTEGAQQNNIFNS